MTEQPTYPPPILHNLGLFQRERQRAQAIEAGMPAYQQKVADAEQAMRVLTAECQQRIADAKQVYEQAKGELGTLGREHTAATDNAAMHYRMAELLCGELGIEVPPELAEAQAAGDGHITRPQALPAGVVPVWQEPARPDPLTDPSFNLDGRREVYGPDPAQARMDDLAVQQMDERNARDDRQAGDGPDGHFPPGTDQQEA